VLTSQLGDESPNSLFGGVALSEIPRRDEVLPPVWSQLHHCGSPQDDACGVQDGGQVDAVVNKGFEDRLGFHAPDSISFFSEEGASSSG